MALVVSLSAAGSCSTREHFRHIFVIVVIIVVVVATTTSTAAAAIIKIAVGCAPGARARTSGPRRAPTRQRCGEGCADGIVTY